MFELILVANVVVAFVRSESVARDPDVRVASVRFLVAYDQTSEARSVVVAAPPVIVLDPFDQISATNVPNVVKDRVGEAHTSAAEILFSDAIKDALFDMRVASEVEALSS